MSARRAPEAGGGKAAGKGRRLIWFVGFYACSLLAFTALVYALRAIVRG